MKSKKPMPKILVVALTCFFVLAVVWLASFIAVWP